MHEYNKILTKLHFNSFKNWILLKNASTKIEIKSNKVMIIGSIDNWM